MHEFAKWTLRIGVIGAILYSTVGFAAEGTWAGPGWYEVQIDRPPQPPASSNVGGPWNNEHDCLATLIPDRAKIIRKFGDTIDWRCIHYATKAEHGRCAPYGVNKGCK
jgi:hypothetical protein